MAHIEIDLRAERRTFLQGKLAKNGARIHPRVPGPGLPSSRREGLSKPLNYVA